LCCHGRHAPFLIPFKDRARVFQSVVSADREQFRQDSYAHHGFGPHSFATIHRTSLLQDGFEQLNRLGDAIKVALMPLNPRQCE